LALDPPLTSDGILNTVLSKSIHPIVQTKPIYFRMGSSIQAQLRPRRSIKTLAETSRIKAETFFSLKDKNM
jgi:hypothetical protein